ncbi:MAG: alpha/beta hydrolase, partial [Lachnospiraceae bacterium]|nr:alpha/beta hydrolase [Lachnospiraceae bacterium]
MTIHEFGTENEQVVVLVHPSIVMWDYFEYVIPLMEKKYHLVIPAIPGYDPEVKGDFSSVEEISAELEDWLIRNDLRDVACIYGCSMGGSIVVRMLADNRLNIRSAVIDGGITPYQLPWI